MTSKTTAYEPEDWIVHRHHGVGQIMSIDVKQIQGRENTYCRIQTREIMIWVPVEKMNDEWLRPLAPPAEIKQALKILESPPITMSADPLKRSHRIKRAKGDHSPAATAEIIRDLWVHKKMKATIPSTEMDALRYFTDLFLSEWSVSMGLEMGEVELQLNKILAKAEVLEREKSIEVA